MRRPRPPASASPGSRPTAPAAATPNRGTTSCGHGSRVGCRREPELGPRREDTGLREAPAPQSILEARPEHAEAVDHRAAEADFARFLEIPRRAGDLADTH